MDRGGSHSPLGPNSLVVDSRSHLPLKVYPSSVPGRVSLSGPQIRAWGVADGFLQVADVEALQGGRSHRLELA